MAFLNGSRYVDQETIEVTLASGKKARVVKLRRLPETTGEATAVNDQDRHDLVAHKYFREGAKFWHLADANTELEARRLIDVSGGTIRVPKE